MVAFNDHVFECDQCFRLVDSPEKDQAAYEAINKYLLLGEEHLDYGQVAGYVDGTLDAEDRGSVSTHIEHCTGCASEVREIAEIKARIDAGRRANGRVRIGISSQPY